MATRVGPGVDWRLRALLRLCASQRLVSIESKTAVRAMSAPVTLIGTYTATLTKHRLSRHGRVHWTKAQRPESHAVRVGSRLIILPAPPRLYPLRPHGQREYGQLTRSAGKSPSRV